MRVMLDVANDPDFYPDSLELDAVPPVGSSIIGHGWELRVTEVNLRVRSNLPSMPTYWLVTAEKVAR